MPPHEKVTLGRRLKTLFIALSDCVALMIYLLNSSQHTSGDVDLDDYMREIRAKFAYAWGNPAPLRELQAQHDEKPRRARKSRPKHD